MNGTSHVVDMQYLFSFAKSFNQPLENWDVSQVTTMQGMFDSATSFNQPLAKWDVGKVVKMAMMFRGATSFDQPLGDWDISSVRDMGDMFENVTFSIPNNDNILMKWTFEHLEHPGLNISLPDGKYCLGKEAIEQILNDYHFDATGREGTQEECQAAYADFQIVSNDFIQVNENSSGVLLTPELSQYYSHLTLVYSISNTDKDDFNINPTTGELRFKNVPDYENPTDKNKNNYYTVSIKASYGLVYARQRVRVRVLDVNENTPPTVENLSNQMITVFDSDVKVVEFDISDAQTASNQLTIMSRQNPFLIVEKGERDSDENTIGFFNYLSDNGLTFMCQDRTEPFSYLNSGKRYAEIVTLLSPTRGNCMKLKTNGNKTHVSVPISYYGFTEGHADSFYKKDTPFIYALEVSDGEAKKVQKMVVLFRDRVRTDPLTEATDILFNETLSLYTLTNMKPTHMAWATRWSIEGKPNWATFDTTTGELSGTASEEKAGNYDINITGYKTLADGLIAKDTESFTLKLLSTDRVPDAFTLERRTGVDINTMTNVSITVSGLTHSTTISLNGGDALYSINNAPKTNADGIVHNGDKITFFMNSSANYSTTRELTVTIGGVSSTWQIITRSAPDVVDRQPDSFQFTPLNNVEFLTMQKASVLITGINADVTIDITNGEYSFDNTTWISTNGILRANRNFKGQRVYVRHLSGDEYGEETRTKLTVGNKSSTFISTVKSSEDKATPPTLTPTKSTYVMDENFTINFPTNALWKSKVTKVKLVGSLMIIQSGNGLVLKEGTDYTLTDNRLVIHSQALRTRLNTYLRDDYFGSWNVVVEATGYEDAYTMFEVQGLQITTPLNVTTPENQKYVVTVTASASPVTFSLANGIDKEKFEINPTTGALKFRTAPDFENPYDADANNVYVVVVKAVDSNSREGYGTIMVEVTDVPNDIPSPTPTVAPDLVDSNDSGVSNSDNITNIAKDVNFDVVCPQKDAIIRFYFNGNAYNNLYTCEGSGVERMIIPIFFDGTSTMNYTQKISEQHVESARSPSIKLTIDTMHPTIVSGIDMVTVSDTGKSNTDNITSEKRPFFNVFCENNESKVKLLATYDSSKKITTEVGCEKTWTARRWASVQFNEDFGDNEYQITYSERDRAGNEALAPDHVNITIDTVAPNAPTVTATGAVVSGTAEAGTTVTAYTPTSNCTTTVDDAGNYSCTLTPAPINGESVEVIVTDDAGNSSPKATATISGITTNHPPVITSGTKFTSYEHDDIIVVGANINATDPDADLLTYSILPRNNGISFDGDKFTITESGILYFKQSPDYEFPLSYDSANYMDTSYYDVCVKVEDGRGGEAETCVQIDIINKSTDVTFEPQNHADNVALDSNLKMTFTNPVKTLSKGTGNIKIFKKDGDELHTDFSVSVAQVEVSGNSITINPNADFEPETEYYVIIDGGVLEDKNGVKSKTIGIKNQFELDKDAWTFTTGKAPEPDNPCGCPDFADCMAN